MIKLYGASVSPYVRKVMVALAEKALAYEHVPVGPGDKSADFLEASPLGKIPALSDGDFGIADSTAIATYLDEAYPANRLYLQTPKERAQVVFFDKFGDTLMTPNAGRIFFQRIALPRFFGGVTDEAVVKTTIETDLPPILNHLTRLLGDKAWLMGDRFTMADISCVCGFVNARYAGWEPDAAAYPALTAWIARTLARPSFAKALEADKAMFPAK
jgi:glutathione S-transferase